MAGSLIAAFPQLAEPARLRALACKGLAEVLRRNDQLEDAVRQSSLAIQDIDAAAGKAPDVPEYQLIACDIRLLRHDLLKKTGKDDEAVACLDKCLADARRLYDNDDRWQAGKRLLGASIARCNDLYNQRRLTETVKLAGESLELIGDMEDSPFEKELQYFTVGFHQLCGWSLMDSGKPDKAVAHWQQIIGLTDGRPLLRDGEDMGTSASVYRAYCLSWLDPQRSIEEVAKLEAREGLAAVQIFNLACAAAYASPRLPDPEQVMRGKETAVRLLERADAKGYFREGNTFERLTGNAVFEHLNDMPGFQALRKTHVESTRKEK